MTTSGINHLGLTVRDLSATTDFFSKCLGWELLAEDATYPRSTVSDGHSRFTLWQVDQSAKITDFDRKTNIGLHHVALEVGSEEELQDLFVKIREWPGVEIEFAPEPLSGGPRMHMMFAEPGGIRLEVIWPATS